MQNNTQNVLPAEKIISILSYITMGVIGLIWLIIAYFLKKKLRFFLMYNITQSIIISVFLAIFKLVIDLILSIIALVPFLSFIAAVLNLIISLKVVTLPILHLSFTIFELFVSILLIYIIYGLFMGRILYIPKLTNFMHKIVKA